MLAFAGSMVLLLIQGGICYFLEYEAVEYFYPFITHLPLMILLVFFIQKRLWAVNAVLTAYLCCQLRRWLSLFIVALMGGNMQTQELAEIFLTIPLMLVLIKYIAPAVRSISGSSAWVQYQFSFIPAVYYIFDYMTQVYLGVFLEGSPVVSEFMSFVCSVAYLIFVLRTYEEKWIRSQLEQMQDSLNQQVSQAVREIEALRKSQEKTRQYRHDLRHHMQYISACIENGRTEQVKEYVREVCTQITESKVEVFCENETANLILSSFAARAREKEVPMKIQTRIPKQLTIAENDLCVLLSNALENALNACLEIQGETPPFLEIMAFDNKGKLWIQITNSCGSKIPFVHGVPVTDRPGHGIGVKSICALVEKYNGLYSFSQENDRFVLRVTI